MLLLPVLLAIAAANPAQTLSVLGNGQAQACQANAKLAADGMMSPAMAEASCTDALAVEQLTPRDRAATLNNRGVIRLEMLGELGAVEDFNSAVDVEPSLGASYANRGAVLIREQRFDDAVRELNRAIEGGRLEEPWKAYYNRGLAREELSDLKGAYADYRMALQLKPGWAPAVAELTRFTVTPAPRGN